MKEQKKDIPPTGGKAYEVEVSDIFRTIGKAKELVARGMMARRKKEEELRMQQLKDRLSFWDPGVEYSGLEAIEAAERELDEQIQLVASGVLHKYSDDTIE